MNNFSIAPTNISFDKEEPPIQSCGHSESMESTDGSWGFSTLSNMSTGYIILKSPNLPVSNLSSHPFENEYTPLFVTVSHETYCKLPILSQNYQKMNPTQIDAFISKNKDLVEILNELEGYIAHQYSVYNSSLEYFFDPDEDIEAIEIRPHFDYELHDNDSLTSVENNILDLFFFPNKYRISGRLFLSV